MSSIISIISFFILLLATFSYSVPIGKNYGNSTVNYNYTASQPFVSRGVPVNITLTSNNQTTNVSIIYPDQSSEGSSSMEVTTWGVTRSPRTSENDEDFEDLSDGSYEESSVPSSTQINEKRAAEEPSFPSGSESSEKRSADESAFPSANQNQERSAEEPSFPSESESNEKRSSEESAFPSENNINEKRAFNRTRQGTVVNKKPTSFVNSPSYTTRVNRTGSFKPSTVMNSKRAFEEPSFPSESESNEKRSSEEPAFPSENNINEKRALNRTQQGTVVKKRPASFFNTPSYTTRVNRTGSFKPSTVMNSKRAFEEPSFPPESESNEKRSSEESAFPSENNINEKRAVNRTRQGTVGNKRPVSFFNSPSYTTPVSRTGPLTTSTGINNKRAVEDYLYTTLESSTQFNQRAIRPFTSAQEVDLLTIIAVQNQTEMTTDAVPSSSVETFGQYTGLLNTEQSSTSDYETTELPFQGSRLTKTVAIIPGTITETRIYGNSPSQYIQPVPQQLSQVQNE